MKYWKRITDAGCPDSTSAYDRKRALDSRQQRQEREKKREREKSKTRLIRDTSSLLRIYLP